MAKAIKNRRLLLNNIILVFIILFFSEASSQNLTDSSIYSYAIMKMDYGTSNKVYSLSTSFTKPDEIYINGIKQINNQAVNSFTNNGENYATLIWKKPITSCKEMFFDCGHIIEIDFSNFNFSQVTNMLRMFKDCYMLKSLNLSNFYTLGVSGNMGDMFWNCYALESLDISNFVTSQVTGFGHM